MSAASDAAIECGMAELIVGGPLLRILQRFVSFVGFLEAALGVFVSGIAIRVAFFGEPAVGGFDFLIGGVPFHAQYFVIVALGHVCAVL